MAELFPEFVGALSGTAASGYTSTVPFWIGFGNLYTLEAVDDTDRRLCYGHLSAATPFPVAVTNDAVFHGLDLHLQRNRQPRYMYFCENGWRNRGPWFRAMDNLAEITQYDNYPADGVRGQNLDVMMPISSTFYHELFHLTDTPTTPTADPYSTYAPFPSSLWADPIDLINLLIMVLQWVSLPFSVPRARV
jgi:hypothetical protein